MEKIRDLWGWFMAFGLMLSALGVAAILVPWVPGLALVIMVGIIFLVAGLVHLVHALQCRGWGGVTAELLSGLLYLLVGGMLVMRPEGGLAAFTLILAVLLIMQGIFAFVLSGSTLKGVGKGMMIFGGIVAVLLGVMIWAGWPLSAVWFIGTLIGVNLVIKGWAVMGLALDLKKA